MMDGETIDFHGHALQTNWLRGRAGLAARSLMHYSWVVSQHVGQLWFISGSTRAIPHKPSLAYLSGTERETILSSLACSLAEQRKYRCVLDYRACYNSYWPLLIRGFSLLVVCVLCMYSLGPGQNRSLNVQGKSLECVHAHSVYLLFSDSILH